MTTLLGNVDIKPIKGLIEEAVKYFAWFQQRLIGNKAANTLTLTTDIEISMWFQTSPMEYHNWFTVEKKGLEFK